MYVNLAIGVLWFGIALYFALFDGVATAFALCYLPALMFTRIVKGYPLNGGWPDLTPANVTVLAMAFGAVLRFGQDLRIRWGLMDTIVLIAPIFSMISAASTENIHTGYNEFMKQFCGWWVPYFVARFSFRSEAFRERFLQVLIVCIFALMPFVLIELRLWPHSFQKFVQSLGISIAGDWRAETRMGLFRTGVSFAYPIFFGDACVSIAGLLVILAATTKIGLRNNWVRLAIACTGFGLWASLSYGPYGAMAVAILIFMGLRYVPITRSLLCPAAVLAAVAGYFITAQIAGAPLPERPRDGGVADSVWVRQLIVHNSWTLVQNAGPFGHGRWLDIDLDSVDNAYLLFAMVRGWIYCVLWLAIPAAVALKASKAMRAYRQSQAHIVPLAAGAAATMGVAAGFYGVWAGYAGEPYTMLWICVIAFTMSAADQCLDAAAGLPPQLPVGETHASTQRGFAPLPPRRAAFASAADFRRPATTTPGRPMTTVGPK